MANVDDDLDLDVGAGKKGGKMKMIIIISVLAVVLIGGSVAVTMMLLGGDDEQKTEQQAKGNSDKKDEKDSAAPIAGEGSTIAYLDMDPAFVVNLDSKESDIRYLQIKMSVMVENEPDIELVKKHAPVIRHHLNMLFSSLDFNDIATREGKVKLTEESLKIVQDALEKAEGAPVVKAVFFNSIVGQ